MDLLEIAENLKSLEVVLDEVNLPLLDRAHEALCYMAVTQQEASSNCEFEFDCGDTVWVAHKDPYPSTVTSTFIDSDLRAYEFDDDTWCYAHSVFATREEAEEAWRNAQPA